MFVCSDLGNKHYVQCHVRPDVAESVVHIHVYTLEPPENTWSTRFVTILLLHVWSITHLKWPALLYLPVRPPCPLFPLPLTPLEKFLQWFRHDFDKKFESDRSFYVSMVQEVRERMELGRHKESMTSRALTSDEQGVSEVELSYYVASPFGAGVDTVRQAL